MPFLPNDTIVITIDDDGNTLQELLTSDKINFEAGISISGDLNIYTPSGVNYNLIVNEQPIFNVSQSGDIIFNTNVLLEDVEPISGTSAVNKIYVDNKIINISGTLSRNNYKLVKSISDLPTPISGKIQLENDHTYEINGEVNIGSNEIIFGDDTYLIGLNPFEDSLEYLGDGYGLQAYSGHVGIKNIGLSAPSGTVCLYSGTNKYGDIIDIYAVAFKSCKKLGTFKNMSTVTIKNCQIMDNPFIPLVQGFDFSNNLVYLLYLDNLALGQSSSTPIISLKDGATISGLAIQNSFFNLGTSLSPAISIASGVLPPERGIVLGNAFAVNTIPISGVASDNIYWKLKTNTGLEDSSTYGSYHLDNSVTTDIISAATPVKISGSTTPGLLSGFTATNNRLTYIGIDNTTVEVIVPITVISLKNNITVNIYIAKNGTVLPETKSAIKIRSASNQYNTTLGGLLVHMSKNDFIEIWIENNDTTDDIIVDSLFVTIIGQ